LSSFSLTIFGGEIIGIAGVEGSGQRQFVEVLAGVRAPGGGTVEYAGQSGGVKGNWNISLIPEDRHKEGLVLDFSVEENFILGRSGEFSGRVFLKKSAIAAFVREAIGRLHIRPSSPSIAARFLSGGNQQKVIIGRELSRSSDLIIAHQPTRGLDIGASDARFTTERRKSRRPHFIRSGRASGSRGPHRGHVRRNDRPIAAGVRVDRAVSRQRDDRHVSTNGLGARTWIPDISSRECS
jgi:ABC-type uncharacterized transport system ATPase subunit